MKSEYTTIITIIIIYLSSASPFYTDSYYAYFLLYYLFLTWNKHMPKFLT